MQGIFSGPRSKFNSEIDAVPAPESRDRATDTAIILDGREARALKPYLPGGALETLLTNGFGISSGMFRQLYFLRWPVGENYKPIKEKVGLTDFRGYPENSAMQEFSMLLTNLALAIKEETDGIIGCTINQKGSKNRYMTNKNELVGCLCRLPEYMDADTLPEKFNVIRDIFSFAISHRVQDKKGIGEPNPHKPPRNVKHHYNNKATY